MRSNENLRARDDSGPRDSPTVIARVNGVPLHRVDEPLSRAELSQRACVELLRQAAQEAGILGTDDVPEPEGVITESASAAIDTLLEREIEIPEPSEDACRRHYAAHIETYLAGERVHARHILFALTPGMDVVALRNRAEACLLDVRCRDRNDHESFARAARELSNCPSAAIGGDLGWLTREDCAPELVRELFARTEVGVLPRLVHSRFGFHVVEVVARERGSERPFEAVHGAVRARLRQQRYVTALSCYLRTLAGRSTVTGVEFDTDAAAMA